MGAHINQDDSEFPQDMTSEWMPSAVIAALDQPTAAIEPVPPASSTMREAYDRLTNANVRQLGRRSFLDVGVATPQISLDSSSSDLPPDSYGAYSTGGGGTAPRGHSSGSDPRRPSSTSENCSLSRRPSSVLADHSKLTNRHACVSIFFSDLIGFSTWAHELDPEIIMATLNDLYTRLDDIILEEMPGVYKV